MNKDTLRFSDLERGVHTLTHDWRNVLNGINLRIMSAGYAEKPEEHDAELAEATELIGQATTQLGAFSRKLSEPRIEAISYPTAFFIEDLSAYLSQQKSMNALKVEWKSEVLSRKINIDFLALSQATLELVENSLRHLPEEAKLTIYAAEEDKFLTVSWVEKSSGNLDTSSWGQAPFNTNERGRMGLGTFFARRIFEAHGGRLVYSAKDQSLETKVQIPLELE